VRVIHVFNMSAVFLPDLERLAFERIRFLCSSDGISGGVTRDRRDNPTNVDVIIANARVAPDLYQQDLPRQVFLDMFESLTSSSSSAGNGKVGITKRRYKCYVHRDVSYENTDNVDIRAYQNIVHDCEAWKDPPCVGVAYVKEKIPVSAFPCTTSLDDVSYVKSTSVRVHPRVTIIFESRSIAEDSAVTHKVYARCAFSPKRSYPPSDEDDKALAAMRKIVSQLCAHVVGKDDHIRTKE